MPWNGSVTMAAATPQQKPFLLQKISVSSVVLPPSEVLNPTVWPKAFVKTFKRDYVYVHDRPDAKTVMSQLRQWFEDYNEYHPHKGLKMKSPRQFIRSQLLTASCPV